jgi:hypothetical protein
MVTFTLDTHHSWQAHCSLYIKVLLVKLKTLLPECILLDWPEYKDYYLALCSLRWLHLFKSGRWGGHSPVLICHQKYCINNAWNWMLCLLLHCLAEKKDISSVIIRFVFKNSVKFGVTNLYEFIVSQKLNSVIVFALTVHHTSTSSSCYSTL